MRISSAALLSGVLSSVLLASAVHAQTDTACPNPDEAIYKCKAAGMSYTRSVGENKCTKIECVKATSNTAPASSTTSSEPKKPEVPCAMSTLEVSAKVTACKQQDGFVPVVSFDGRCYIYKGCEKRPIASSASSLPKPAADTSTIVCKKMKLPDGCMQIVCEGGIMWNTCWKPADIRMSSSASSSVGTKSDRCADILKMTNETRKMRAKDPTNEDLRKKISGLEMQWKQCMTANNAPIATTNCAAAEKDLKTATEQLLKDPYNGALLKLVGDKKVALNACKNRQQKSGTSSSAK